MKKHIKILIKRAWDEIYEAEIKITNHKIQAWLFQKEIDDPITMGKKKAEELLKQTEENLSEWEKRIENLKINIEAYQSYIKENNL